MAFLKDKQMDINDINDNDIDTDIDTEDMETAVIPAFEDLATSVVPVFSTKDLAKRRRVSLRSHTLGLPRGDALGLSEFDPSHSEQVRESIAPEVAELLEFREELAREETRQLQAISRLPDTPPPTPAAPAAPAAPAKQAEPEKRKRSVLDLLRRRRRVPVM